MLSRTALCIHRRALSRTNAVPQRIVYRTMHLVCQIKNTTVKSHSVIKISRYSPVLGTCTKRHSSTTEAANTIVNGTVLASTTIENPIVSGETILTSESFGGTGTESLTSNLFEIIPDAPIPPVPSVLDAVSYVGETPFEVFGLGGWTPVGIVQQCLEALHVSFGLPWWESIVIGTVILRFILFPLVIMSQRNGAKMHNNMPELTRLQMEMSEARRCGDNIQAIRAGHELTLFMKEKKCNPLKNMIVPFAQGPIFISVFLGLRRMAEYPVESMKEGGLWWFADLTVSDPYYILPLVTAATLAVTLELGVDSTRADAMGMMRYVLRAIPVVVFPFTLHFPAAILCYWTSANFISLLQVALLRIPNIRTFCKIEPLVNHPKSSLLGKKGFVEEFKSSLANMKATREMSARYEADHVAFLRAGRGPIRKTYSYDPTEQMRTKPADVIAKKK